MKKLVLIFVMSMFLIGATGINNVIASKITADNQISLVKPDKDPKKDGDKKCCKSDDKKSCSDKKDGSKSKDCCSSSSKCCEQKDKAGAKASGNAETKTASGSKCCSSTKKTE